MISTRYICVIFVIITPNCKCPASITVSLTITRIQCIDFIFRYSKLQPIAFFLRILYCVCIIIPYCKRYILFFQIAKQLCILQCKFCNIGTLDRSCWCLLFELTNRNLRERTLYKHIIGLSFITVVLKNALYRIFVPITGSYIIRCIDHSSTYLLINVNSSLICLNCSFIVHRNRDLIQLTTEHTSVNLHNPHIITRYSIFRCCCYRLCRIQNILYFRHIFLYEDCNTLHIFCFCNRLIIDCVLKFKIIGFSVFQIRCQYIHLIIVIRANIIYISRIITILIG